jgi:hypothetical protein
MMMHSLLFLAACAPKTAPEDASFAEAQSVVAAFDAGDAVPLPLDPRLEVEARSSAYMGEFVWEMYAATAAARLTVEPLISGDPRASGRVLAVPAPRDETCCFDVHFLAEVEGQLRPWIVAQAGWEPGVTVVHTLAEGLPEVGEPDPELAERAAKLVAAADLEGERLVVRLADLTGSESDTDVFVYAVPAVDDERMSVGLLARIWTDATTPAHDLSVTPAGKTWSIVDLDSSSGLFLSAPGRVPSHAHIFASRRYGIPLWVSLETGLWRVEGAGVGLFATPGDPR